MESKSIASEFFAINLQIYTLILRLLFLKLNDLIVNLQNINGMMTLYLILSAGFSLNCMLCHT